MILIPILGVLFAALFVVGLVLIIIAARGAYAVEECSCGYDLRRLGRTSTRCPECGAKRGHVTIRDPRLFTVGVIILLSPIAAFALVVLGLICLFTLV